MVSPRASKKKCNQSGPYPTGSHIEYNAFEPWWVSPWVVRSWYRSSLVTRRERRPPTFLFLPTIWTQDFFGFLNFYQHFRTCKQSWWDIWFWKLYLSLFFVPFSTVLLISCRFQIRLKSVRLNSFSKNAGISWNRSRSTHSNRVSLNLNMPLWKRLEEKYSNLTVKNEFFL